MTTPLYSLEQSYLLCVQVHVNLVSSPATISAPLTPSCIFCESARDKPWYLHRGKFAATLHLTFHLGNQREVREVSSPYQAPRRLCGAAPPGRTTEAPGWVPHPLVPYLGPIYSLTGETPKQMFFFRSTVRSRRHPLFFLGRANLKAALASDEGKSSQSSSSSPLHHPSMTSPLISE